VLCVLCALTVCVVCVCVCEWRARKKETVEKNKSSYEKQHPVEVNESPKD